jgi:heme exporter protein B
MSIGALFRHEFASVLRGAASWAFAPVFFLLFSTMSVFALGYGDILAQVGPALVWLAAVFSILLAAQSIFRDDLENGFLDLLMVEDTPLAFTLGMRLLARWLAIGGALMLALPLAGMAFGLDGSAVAGLALSLLLGTPGALLYAAAGAAISAGARGAGEILGPLIAGPLLTPLLIFGIGAANQGAVFGADAKALLAATLFAAAVCPPTCAAALRASTA